MLDSLVVGDITLAQLESNMEKIQVSHQECMSYTTSQSTLDALAGHPLQDHDTVLGVLSYEQHASGDGDNGNFSRLPFDVSRHPDAKSGVALQVCCTLNVFSQCWLAPQLDAALNFPLSFCSGPR